MNKISRIIQLINLLNHRKCVTLQAIKDTCNIQERTAYRYLNAISEANIPVYFNRELGGYCLSRSKLVQIDDFTLTDTALSMLALGLLHQRVNAYYQSDIDTLIEKFLVHQPYTREQTLASIESSLKTAASSADLSDTVSSTLIHTALLCDKSVRLISENDQSEIKNLEIKNPSLIFKHQWWLGGKLDSEPNDALLNRIKKVTIL